MATNFCWLSASIHSSWVRYEQLGVWCNFNIPWLVFLLRPPILGRWGNLPQILPKIRRCPHLASCHNQTVQCMKTGKYSFKRGITGDRATFSWKICMSPFTHFWGTMADSLLPLEGTEQTTSCYEVSRYSSALVLVYNWLLISWPVGLFIVVIFFHFPDFHILCFVLSLEHFCKMWWLVSDFSHHTVVCLPLCICNCLFTCEQLWKCHITGEILPLAEMSSVISEHWHMSLYCLHCDVCTSSDTEALQTTQFCIFCIYVHIFVMDTPIDHII